jgi:methylenetetrahydrofolate reductase (NADPH)
MSPPAVIPAMPTAMPEPEDRRQRRVAALVAAASLEISSRDDPARYRLGELLPPGTSVFVNHPGSVTHHDIVAACARLARAGFQPVPHVAVRRLVSFTQARDYLQRAVGEAGVSRIMLIGGDAPQPAGPFAESSALLTSGLIEQSGLTGIAVAGYPGGHPRIDHGRLDAVLRAKLAEAQRRGLSTQIMTQFGFEAAPIVSWAAALREEGITAPIGIGIAGPATVATLAKFAVRCGVGASLRALGRGGTAFARILAVATPDALVAALVGGDEGAAAFDGLHFFSFGGLRRTAEWIHTRAMMGPAPR